MAHAGARRDARRAPDVALGEPDPQVGPRPLVAEPVEVQLVEHAAARLELGDAVAPRLLRVVGLQPQQLAQPLPEGARVRAPEHLLGPAGGGAGDRRELDEAGELDAVARGHARHPVQARARGIGVPEQARIGLADDGDDGAAALAEAAEALLEPRRHAGERLRGRVAHPRRLRLRIPVPDVDERGAARVRRLAQRPDERRVLDLRVDRELLAGGEAEADLEHELRVPAQLGRVDGEGVGRLHAGQATVRPRRPRRAVVGASRPIAGRLSETRPDPSTERVARA